MMKAIFVSKIIVLFTLLTLVSCKYDHKIEPIETSTTIHLKWNKAYPDDNIQKSLTGLKWALSFVGAALLQEGNGIFISDDTIVVDVSKLGLSEKAEQKLSLLQTKIKESEEYKKNSSIDLGRYVCLLIGASEHYYAITDVPLQLNEVLKKYTFKKDKGYVNNSGISLNHRVIQFSEQNGFEQIFLSEEIDSNSKQVLEYETIELMHNGQIRFGIWDVNGNRKNAVDASHSNAGKPAKCMWCHESSIQQFYNFQKDYPGYLTYSDLQDKLVAYRYAHHLKQKSLSSGVDFSKLQDHTFTELLYISFMEPSAERLALEWGMPIEQIRQRLSGLSTHTYEEFPFLGNLYHRNEIEQYAPFKGLSVSESVREKKGVEVNHID